MQHGGARANSGRNPGGVNQSRRILIDSIERGLAIAGRKRGLIGDDEEVAAQTTAHIVSDMVLAGEGRDVIKIYALATSKSDGAQPGAAGKSSLINALKRLPRGKSGPVSDVDDNDGMNNADNSDSYEQGAPDCQLVALVSGDDDQAPGNDKQPFFSPQKTLELDVFADSSDSAGEFAQPGEPAKATPSTPSGPTPHCIGVDSENFEKNNFENSDDGDLCPA
jgi:hypothetical protein